MRKKICIVTGCRAEWGLFFPLASGLREESESFELQVVATGAHLSEKYGLTYREIEEDGFRIDRRADMPLEEDTEEATLRAVSRGMTSLAEALKDLEPDIVFLLGDRFETFAAATACLFLKIPIAHVHGGELTEGSLDDALRHSITKMAHLHFVSCKAYQKRVIQLGEDPSRVFNVGALGLDNIKKTKLLSKEAFEKKIGFKFGRRNVLVTFNPSTAEDKFSTKEQFKDLLKVIDELNDTKIIFTKPNPDMYTSMILSQIDNYVSQNPGKSISCVSMGRVLYLSALKFVDVVAGNSSSGIIEVPSFGIPTVNIGDRQKGRVRSASVIDVDNSKEAIEKAVRKAFSKNFKEECKKVKNPYGKGNVSEEIIKIIKKMNIENLKKNFFNINFAMK